MKMTPEEKRIAHNLACKRNKAKNILRNEARRLKAKYGITAADRQSMLDKQDGVCAICRNPETATVNGKLKALSVDHCHLTGRVRGLLCTACNLGVGHFSDSPTMLILAAAYLVRQ